MPDKWDVVLERMTLGVGGSGVSRAMLGKVLDRVALAGRPVPRSEISKGSMLIQRTPLASGTVGKAVDALLGERLLTQEDLRRGQPGRPITPLLLGGPGSGWAIAGIRVDLQREGPDTLTGVICGLDRKLLAGPEQAYVPREHDKHDLRGLADAIRKLTEALQGQLAGPPGSAGPPDLLAVGVELGGHVYQGTVIDSTHARWSLPVNLSDELTRELEVPVVVENDVNALAIHGFYEGSLRKPDSMLVGVFRQGIGGALILDGRVRRGSHGMAPEPGHLQVEYRDSDEAEQHLPARKAAHELTFDDECACSTMERKVYGHLDALATPARIEGELAARKQGEKASLAEIAAVPAGALSGGNLVFTAEAAVMRRAGQALGRGLADIINIVNPGQLVLLLPAALAAPIPQSSGAEYLGAAERAVDDAYSTGPADARGEHFRLTVQSYVDDELACEGATAAATTAFNAFIEYARGRGQPLSQSKD